MKILNILSMLTALALLCACQSEAPQEATAPEQVITVRAFLPDSENTRSHITYGNTEIDRELFRWHPFQNDDSKDDYISVFNITRLTECPGGIELAVTKVNGNSAIFEALSDGSKFQVKEGDLIFVNYWAATGKIDEKGRNFFEIEKDAKPQPIVDDPYAEDYMTFMQGSLKMYDIVTVEENGKIPDIHFKHLSGIMRVTLRNETGENIYPKSLSFESQGEKPVFISKLCCGVNTDSADSANLIIYEEANETEYSNYATYFTNNYTAAPSAVGGAIAPGKTYELYVPFIPRFDNKIQSDNLVIKLELRGSSSDSDYPEMTLNNFKTTLEAGKRYWFNLTTVGNKDGERRLMLTSDWLKQQEQNQGSSDQSSSEDE